MAIRHLPTRHDGRSFVAATFFADNLGYVGELSSEVIAAHITNQQILSETNVSTLISALTTNLTEEVHLAGE